MVGKAKEDFEKWLYKLEHDNQSNFYNDVLFYNAPFSMQFGVIVDWFDSVFIRIGDYHIAKEEANYFESNVNGYLGAWSTRHEARTKAIEKACEIYNEKNTKSIRNSI